MIKIYEMIMGVYPLELQVGLFNVFNFFIIH